MEVTKKFSLEFIMTQTREEFEEGGYSNQELEENFKEFLRQETGSATIIFNKVEITDE